MESEYLDTHDTEVSEREVPVPARLTPRGLASTVRSLNTPTRLPELPLDTFAAKLLTDTFEAIVGATAKQAETYASIMEAAQLPVSELAERISEAQISAFLAERYPDHMGGTVVRRDYTFEDTPDGDEAVGRSANEKLRQVVDSLRKVAPLLAHGARLGLADPPDDARSFSYLTRDGDDQISWKIRRAVAVRLAEQLKAQLGLIVGAGLPRLRVSGGEVATKLTFRLSATEAERRETARLESDSLGAYVRGTRNGFAKTAASVGLSRLSVSPVNEETFDPTLSSSAIVGELRLRFTAETFPTNGAGAEAMG